MENFGQFMIQEILELILFQYEYDIIFLNYKYYKEMSCWFNLSVFLTGIIFQET